MTFIICAVALTTIVLAVTIAKKCHKSDLKAFKKYLADEYVKGEPVMIVYSIYDLEEVEE